MASHRPPLHTKKKASFIASYQGNGMTERIPTEHEEQREVVKWFRQTYTEVRIFAIPNGEKRTLGVATRLKVEGVSPGVPDLYAPAWRLWVEMKRIKGGTISPQQKDWHIYLRSIGDTVLVCKGAEEAKEQIIKFREGK
jgi:hypothetical protein